MEIKHLRSGKSLNKEWTFIISIYLETQRLLSLLLDTITWIAVYYSNTPTQPSIPVNALNCLCFCIARALVNPSAGCSWVGMWWISMLPLTLHEMAPPIILKTYPIVDLRESGSPPQSTSVYSLQPSTKKVLELFRRIISTKTTLEGLSWVFDKPVIWESPVFVSYSHNSFNSLSVLSSRISWKLVYHVNSKRIVRSCSLRCI